MCFKSSTKIPWSWFSIVYFLFIVSHSSYVQACNEDIKDALQEFRTFIGDKFNEFDSKISNMNWRMNNVDDTLTQIKTDLALVGGTVNSIDSEMMGLGGRSSENHIATRKLTIMQGKLFTEVQHVRENMTEELDTLKDHFESFLIEELNSTMVNISTDLVKGHITTQNINTEVSNIRGNMTEELNSLKDHFESFLIEELNSNMVNISTDLEKGHITTQKITTEVRNMRENMTEELITLKKYFESFLIEELNSTMVNISTELVKGHITTQKINTDVNNLRENITEELNTLSNHVELLIIDDLNSKIVNITEKLAKDHTTAKKCISMQEKMFTELDNFGESMTEELINVTSTVKSSIIKELNTNKCPLSDGFFLSPWSQCLKVFNDQARNWTESVSFCQSEGLVLARPYDASGLQVYLNNKYGSEASYYWIRGRRTGSSINWQPDGQAISNTSALWWPNEPTGYLATKFCLSLTTADSMFEEHPGKPYYTLGCGDRYYHLCELIMN